jgi:hypothetical protein
VSDWTIVATTLGASAITGAVGYFSAKWQGKVGLEQANQETRRLRLQHQEDHLRNRQNTYHEFLDEAATWERTKATTDAIFGVEVQTPEQEETWQERNRRFRHLLNGVYLFGTEPVRRAAKDLFDLHTDFDCGVVDTPTSDA